MGVLQKLYQFFHPDGLRDAVRKSYREQRMHTALPGGTPPHRAGLYGALRTRYEERAQSVNELYVWAELTPFLLMHEETACDALAEYIVYQEFPQRAHKQWLGRIISAALRLPALSRSSPRTMAAMAMMKQVRWCRLLEADVKAAIEQEMSGLQTALDDNRLPASGV